jgi:hypothetical protein
MYFNFYTTFYMFSENNINGYSVHNMGHEETEATDFVATTANKIPSVISQMSVDQKKMLIALGIDRREISSRYNLYSLS